MTMPYLKAFKDVRSVANEKYISKDKVYPIIALDFLDDKNYEFAVIDDEGKEMWFTDQEGDKDNYLNYFKKVRFVIIDTEITI